MPRPAEPVRSAGRGPAGCPRRSAAEIALDQAAKLHEQTVQEQQHTIDELRHQIELYRRYVFGPRRERLVEAPGQGHLFEFDAGDVNLPLPPEPPACESRPPAQSRQSRKLDYDKLPQVRIPHDIPEADKICSHCGEAKACIGEDEARVLNFIPAHFELRSTSCPSTPVLTAAMVWWPPRVPRVP